MKILITLFFAAAVVTGGPLAAHSDTPAASKPTAPVAAEQKPFGIAGDRSRASRTVRVSMSDRMRFTPSVLDVQSGETVKFVVTNNGKLMHEMVLGTQADLQQHADMMKRHPDMEHDEPHMVHVPPGKTGEIVWLFNRPGEFRFACLVGGHFEAGMVGKITVK
jgi:uncharacterized cupredoxin-like copper-binding protein